MSSQPIFIISLQQQKRIIFRCRVQGEIESTRDYVDALRKVAMDCDYDHQILDELICDQFIFGLKGSAIQDHLYAQGDLQKLTNAISTAIEAEDFKNMRFQSLHPLQNEEIWNVLEPYLDNNNLLGMRLVSTKCRDHAEAELGHRQKKVLLWYQWSPASGILDYETSLTLKFSLSGDIAKFMLLFGGNEAYGPTWPFFGQGILDIDFDVCKHVDIVNFLEIFGGQVTMLIWRNLDEETTVTDMKTMLQHTLNLKTLWAGYLGDWVQIKTGLNINTWPELPYLTSLHCSSGDWSEMKIHPILQFYGSQLTSLNIRQSIEIPPLIQQLPNSEMIVLPFSNVCDLTIEEFLPAIHEIAMHTDWKLKRLSIESGTLTNLIQDCKKYKDLDDYVNASHVIWSLIHQSRETLEEIYLSLICEDFKDCIQLFLLPYYHNPVFNITKCPKVVKLTIPSLFLIRIDKVFTLIRSTFPSVKHIQVTQFGCFSSEPYESFIRLYRHLLSNNQTLLEAPSNLFFDPVDFNIPISCEQLSQKILHLWNDIASLRKFTVLAGLEADSEEMEVVFQQIRNSTGNIVTVTAM